MSAAKRKLLARLLIIGANLATIAVIVEVGLNSPARAAVLVAACVAVVLVLERRQVARYIHRFVGH